MLGFNLAFAEVYSDMIALRSLLKGLNPLT